ncbi:eukaryotic translation initiation factor 2D [Paramuricea clavata]|uniref:Eukaryotic translation initiation factor 2D n=1 Tax=Paramuricea clavata TaxID=317549 RepID=A0A6S7I0S0_PARCT|nr:eukaryotic translation initiation factor 2D [Paramuricea clavata]
MSVMKIMTHSGQHVTAYTLNGSPIFFQVETQLYPTVYILWKYPDMIPVFTTWPNVFEKLRGGADLMLPGVIQIDLDKEQEFKKQQVCSVALLGNRAPVAVGYTAVSSSEAREQGMRGKGVIILHSYLDHLWSQGSKCDIPMILPTSYANPSEVEDKDNKQTDVVDSGTNENSYSTNIDSNKNDVTIETTAGNIPGDECNETLSKNINSIGLTEHAATAGSSSLNSDETLSTQVANVLSSSKDDTEDTCPEETDVTLEEDTTGCCPTDSMDTLLERSLMHALLCIKNNELPILTSTFYKNYLLPCCPQDQTLDIKKSSYKKLTKFLQVMEDRGFIAMKEQSKGVHCIDNVNWAHENLKTFKKENSDIISEKRQNDSESIPTNKYQPPEIEDVFAVSGSTRPLFECRGYSKGAILTAKEVRQVATDYIKSQELASSQNKR